MIQCSGRAGDSEIFTLLIIWHRILLDIWHMGLDAPTHIDRWDVSVILAPTGQRIVVPPCIWRRDRP